MNFMKQQDLSNRIQFDNTESEANSPQIRMYRSIILLASENVASLCRQMHYVLKMEKKSLAIALLYGVPMSAFQFTSEQNTNI